MVHARFWQFIYDKLRNSHSVILLCVVDSLGSSPGRRGFKMAVAEDGIFGSIGGGIMEHKFVEMAKEKLRSLPVDPVIKKQIHDKSAPKNQSGMICSGEQTIVLFHLTKMHEGITKEIIKTLSAYGDGVIRITADAISFAAGIKNENDFLFRMQSEQDWIYKENLGFKNHLYIIGGGHCALAFSSLMSSMDFFIHLYEDRKDLNTFELNCYANEKKLVNDYSEIKSLVPSGHNIYVVIMTFGYRTDDLAVRTLIDKDFKYFGVLGSQSKMEKMFDGWQRDGLPPDRLKKIFAPVGLKINSRTPDEIAISIAAEIISVKNKN